MTTYYVSPTGLAGNSGLTAGSPKSVASALSVAGSGDVLSLADGNYPRLIIENKTIGVCATTLPTPTIVPGWASPHPARTNKGVHIDTLTLRNSPQCTFFDLDIVLKQWIDTTDGTHTTRNGSWHTGFGASDPFGIIGQDETSHHPVFTGCEVRWGYGPNQDPFDPSVKYPEFQSGAWASSAHNAIGHGDPYQSWWQVDNVLTGAPGYTPASTSIPNGRAYNTIAEAPYGFSGRSEADAPEFIKCYFHDMNKGIVASTNRGRLVVDQCWFERMYSILIQLACDNVALSNGFQLTRNLYSGVFNSSLDSGNPHGDILQHFVYIVDADPNKVIRLQKVWIERNFWISRPTDRGFAQFLFLQGGRTGSNEAVYVNPIIRDNFALQKGNNLGLEPAYIEDGVISNNMAVSIPGAAQPSPATIGARRNTKDGFAGVVVLEDNIAEAMGSGSHLKSTGNVSTGQGYSSVTTANLYTGTFPPADNSLPGWYAATVRKAPYSTKGPRFATLYAALTDALSTANVKVFVGWAAKSLMPKGQLVTGLPSAIRGPSGENVTVSVDIGQFRIINEAGTVVTDWTSSSTVTAVGNRIIPRHTSSTSFAGLVTQTVTLTHAGQGAQAFQFKSTTVSNTAFPKVGLAKTGTQLIARGAVGPDTKKAMMALMFRLPEITVNTNSYLVGHVDTQTGFRARVLPTATGNTLRIAAWANDSTTSIFGTNVNSGEMNLTSDYLLILSMDTALGAAGFSAAIWDMTLGGNPIAFNTPPSPVDIAIGFSNSTGAPANRVINNGTNSAGCHLSFYMLALNQWLDATDPESVRKLMAAYIGGTGKGVFGTTPEIFLTGDAAKYNAGNFNLGSSALKFGVENGTVTDISTSPWPPVLDLTAEIVSPTPFVIDEDITIQITPAGYAEPGSVISLVSDTLGDFPVYDVALPEGSQGITVAYTPRVVGSHTVAAIHSGGYNSPPSQVVEVTDPYTYIEPGSSATLTSAQRDTIQFRTYLNSSTADVSVGLSYRSKLGETGTSAGVNYLVDVSVPIPKIWPGATWNPAAANDGAGSGGTVASVPLVTNQPACRPLDPDFRVITASGQTIAAMAYAKGGLKRVECIMEGRVATSTQMTPRELIDPRDGSIATEWGYVFDVDYDAFPSSGRVRYYYKAYPKNPLMQPIVMGPYELWRSPNQHDATITVNTGLGVTATNKHTIGAAITAADTAGHKRPRILVQTSGTYSEFNEYLGYATCRGMVTVEGDSGVQVTIGSATVFTGSFWRPFVNGLCLGKNVTYDQKNIPTWYIEPGYYFFVVGGKVTNSLGRYGTYRKKPIDDPFSNASGKLSLWFATWTDVTQGPLNAVFCHHSTISKILADGLTNVVNVGDCVIDDFSAVTYRAHTPAMTIVHTGGTTATVAKIGANGAGDPYGDSTKTTESVTVANATDTITTAQDWVTGTPVRVSATTYPGGLAANTTYYIIRVSATEKKLATTYALAVAGTAINITTDGATVKLEPYTTAGLVFKVDGVVSFVAPISVVFGAGNYNVSDLTTLINTKSGFTAVTLDDTVYAAALSEGANWGAFGDTNIQTTALTLRWGFDVHGDVLQYFSPNNIVAYNLRITNIDQHAILFFNQADGGPFNSFFGNILGDNPVAAPSSQSPSSLVNGVKSGLSIVHSAIFNQYFNTSAGLLNCEISNNIFFRWNTGTQGSVTGTKANKNLIMDLTGAPTYDTNRVATATLDAMLTNYGTKDFRPKAGGPLLDNLLPPLLPFDIDNRPRNRLSSIGPHEVISVVPVITTQTIELPTTGETTLDLSSQGAAIPTGETVTITIPANLPPGITFSVE